MLDSEIVILERARRFCVNYMQSLNIRTRTDVALGLSGIYPIENEIDFKKLILFGQLCRLDSGVCMGKNVFFFRLFSYMTNADRQSGFIPDIIRLLENYQLRHIVYNFLENSTLPSKCHWKRLVKSKIHENVVLAWKNRKLLSDFCRFRSL